MRNIFTYFAVMLSIVFGGVANATTCGVQNVRVSVGEDSQTTPLGSASSLGAPFMRFSADYWHSSTSSWETYTFYICKGPICNEVKSQALLSVALTAQSQNKKLNVYLRGVNDCSTDLPTSTDNDRKVGVMSIPGGD